MATHSGVLAWRIPGTGEPGGLLSTGLHRVGHYWSDLAAAAASIWKRQCHPTPVLLPGKSHGRRSLVGCSSWGLEESNTTEQLHFHFSLSCIGEGNGNPLQCSCLENPRDGRAWWGAVYGVAQNRTWLKQLSSSSSSPSGVPVLWGIEFRSSTLSPLGFSLNHLTSMRLWKLKFKFLFKTGRSTADWLTLLLLFSC